MPEDTGATTFTQSHAPHVPWSRCHGNHVLYRRPMLSNPTPKIPKSKKTKFFSKEKEKIAYTQIRI